MTVLLLVVGAAVGGLITGTAATLIWHLHQIDAHEWQIARLTATRVDVLARTADHDHRYARRLETRCRALRAANADLIRTIAVMTQTRRRPQPAGRRSPVPDYGIRAAAS